jgi:hypothetical protein
LTGVSVRFVIDPTCANRTALTEHESGGYVGQATDVAPAVWDVEVLMMARSGRFQPEMASSWSSR